MNKHELDVVSLSFGWVFLAITAWWLVVTTVDINLPSAGCVTATEVSGAGSRGSGAACRRSW
jgi:hypothetical protein